MTGLSYDLGRAVGLAVWQDGELTHLDPALFDHTYFGGALWFFSDYVHATFKHHKPAWVAYEEVMTKNKYHAELHFGMVGVLAMIAYDHNIPLIGINTMTMKKHVTGTGRCNKEQMVAEIRRRYPKYAATLDHNMADAVAVGITALSKMEDDGK